MSRDIVTSENRDEYMAKKLGIDDKKENLTPIYHGTSAENAEKIEKKGFNVKHSADGSIWFTSDPKIGEVAATGKGGVITRHLDKSKMKLAGWDESDKYGVDELINKGFHGVEYPKATKEGHTHYQIFYPEMLKKKHKKSEK